MKRQWMDEGRRILSRMWALYSYSYLSIASHQPHTERKFLCLCVFSMPAKAKTPPLPSVNLIRKFVATIELWQTCGINYGFRQSAWHQTHPTIELKEALTCQVLLQLTAHSSQFPAPFPFPWHDSCSSCTSMSPNVDDDNDDEDDDDVVGWWRLLSLLVSWTFQAFYWLALVIILLPHYQTHTHTAHCQLSFWQLSKNHFWLNALPAIRQKYQQTKPFEEFMGERAVICGHIILRLIPLPF